jgi:RNA polymerase sigma-70 factor (ECF subfamily)
LGEIDDQAGITSRLQAGDVATWEALYERIHPAMLAYAERRLGKSEDARDAVSEAITRAVAGIDKLVASGASAEGWFFGILRHVVLDQHRRNYRRRTLKVSRDIIEDEPSEKIVMKEEWAILRAAFAQLPERDRDLLELRVVVGLSSEDTASVLGMRSGAVRTAQTRALSRLRNILTAADSREAQA